MIKAKCATMLVLVLVAIPGCVKPGAEPVPSTAESEERAFVEGQLYVLNPLTSNFYQRPIRFGLINGQEYVLQFTAEKFMGNVDAEMTMVIVLPEGLEYQAGDLEWTGIDKRATIEARVRAVKNGEYVVKATATNLKSGFRTQVRAVICIGNEEVKIKQCVGTR